jgi:8-oxo-dGTP pyrophosphatase MutT (NUDIX family)
MAGVSGIPHPDTPSDASCSTKGRRDARPQPLGRASVTQYPYDEERHRLVCEWIARGPQMTCAGDAPDWLAPLLHALRHAQPSQLSTNDPVADQIAHRQAAVLILLSGADPGGINVVLLQRASGLRDHPGEISFPGGSWERDDTSPVATALREATEETGVDPADVSPLLLLPRLFIRASSFDVTAVVAFWHRPMPQTPVDAAETHRVLSVPLRELADPRRWQTYTVPGWHGPSTCLDDALLWGYTAEVLAFMSRNIRGDESHDNRAG